MKTIHTTILATSLLTLSMSTQAVEVKTSAQALGLCKAQAAIAHPNYKRSTLKKVKQSRGKFKINLSVLTEQGKTKTICEVTREGTVTYTKKS